MDTFDKLKLFEQNSEITNIINETASIIKEYKKMKKIYDETLIAMGKTNINKSIFCRTDKIPLNKNIMSAKDFQWMDHFQ